jgi:putative endonuclease
MADETQYWIYILNCSNNTYYTGITTDLVRRFQEHQAGTAKCKYTRSFKPVNIAQCWSVKGSNAALKVEKFIKKMSRKAKDRLVTQPHLLAQFAPMRKLPFAT